MKLDWDRLSTYEKPFFSIHVWNNTDQYYIGPFYYFKSKINDSPAEPMWFSENKKIGVWFLPGIKISNNSRN